MFVSRDATLNACRSARESPPPETAWPREFPLATADPDDIPRDPKLRTPDDGQVAWFRVLPLDLKEGQRLVLTVTATDTDDLNGPHTTRGDPPNTFTIVSAEELQFTLYQKELNLRRRFEQVITAQAAVRNLTEAVVFDGAGRV